MDIVMCCAGSVRCCQSTVKLCLVHCLCIVVCLYTVQIHQCKSGRPVTLELDLLAACPAVAAAASQAVASRAAAWQAVATQLVACQAVPFLAVACPLVAYPAAAAAAAATASAAASAVHPGWAANTEQLAVSFLVKARMAVSHTGNELTSSTS